MIRVIKLRASCMWYVVGRKGMRREFWIDKPERKRPLGRPRVDRKTILKNNLKTQFGKAWTGFMWVSIGTSRGLL
jgi:hypothetical protein